MPVKLEGDFKEHLKYLRDPRTFMREVLGITKTWEGQDEITEAVRTHDRVSVASGYSLGKDYIGASLMLWFLLSHYPSIVIATAPSDRQVEMIIWGELANKFYNARDKLGGRFLNKYLEMDVKERWYAVGFTTRDVHRSPGKFQGFHQKNVFILFSEAQAIEKTIWEQGESLMASGNCKWLATGNAIVNQGAFFETFQPKSGWHNIKLDGEKNPNYVSGTDVIPGLATRRWIDSIAAKHGRDSAIYKSMVKGVFPARSENTFIELDWLEWANWTGMDTVSKGKLKIAGCDPASYGNNKTVITIREGMKVTETRKFEKKSTMETTGILVGLLQNEGCDRVVLDVTGIGAGIYDRMVELGLGNRVVPVNFGGKPNLASVNTDGTTPRDVYMDAGTQMYGHVAKLLEYKRMAMEYDDDRNLQLLNRRMTVQSNGKMKLESKDEFKARGFASPDEADSLVLTFSDQMPPIARDEPFVTVTEDETLGAMYE